MISQATIATIDKFTSMVKRSSQAHSKDIRMEMTDATSLMAEITNILARLAVYENAGVTQAENTTVEMRGGTF